MAFNRLIMSLALVGISALPLSAKEKVQKTAYGFVNFETCVSSSLRGKKSESS